MADNRPNNKNFAPPTAEDEEAARILLSFKDNNANTSQALINPHNTMSPDKKTTQQTADVRTLEQAIAQGAPVPSPASTSGTPSRLVISSGGQAVRKPKTSKKPFTSRLTSDVAAKFAETQRGIRERVIVNPDRTILAGRTENLGQKEKKVVVNHTRRAINASDVGQNDVIHIDSNTDGKNTISSRIRDGNVLPNRSIDHSPTPQQRRNGTTMAAAQGPLSLRKGGFSGGSGETPAHKPSINPFNGAQTTTAQHFLRTTANLATAGDDARRAHLNNANEFARSLAVAPPVNNYNDFAIIDGNDYAVIEGNRPATPCPSHQPYDAVAATTGASKCSTFRPVYIHTAKCDECNTRNRSVLYRCNTCSTQLDRACMTNNHEHGAHVKSLDWTDHGAQSASKPRGTAGPRVKKTRAKNVAAKKKVSAREEAALEEQLDSNDEKDKKKKKKKREANSLSEISDGAFEDDGSMILSPRVRIKCEDKKARSPPPAHKPARAGAGAEKRKAEETDIYEWSDNNAPKASKASRRPLATSSNGGVQSQQRAPVWSKSTQSGFADVPTQSSARSAGSGGIKSFFAEADRLREEYTRVTQEVGSMKSRLVELQAEKNDIEAKILKRMGK